MAQLYHVMNHSVEGRDLFADDQDYARFVHDLYEFNDTAPASEFIDSQRRGRIRERLVDIHAWVLMKDHFHLLLSEVADGGLSLFLRKLTGYARYFNERHKRRGVLFRGRTKKVRIETQGHFLYVLHYIHANPLDYLPGSQKWRERDKGFISDIGSALTHLDAYRWSSYPDYSGKRNFPSILSKEIFSDVYGNYSDSMRDFLADRTNLEVPLAPLE